MKNLLIGLEIIIYMIISIETISTSSL
jgi:hypothetical protein